MLSGFFDSRWVQYLVTSRLFTFFYICASHYQNGVYLQLKQESRLRVISYDTVTPTHTHTHTYVRYCKNKIVVFVNYLVTTIARM